MKKENYSIKKAYSFLVVKYFKKNINSNMCNKHARINRIIQEMHAYMLKYTCNHIYAHIKYANSYIHFCALRALFTFNKLISNGITFI